ncbi:hypothetical protein RB595_005740 [Gaeumannomyces hyphopodioides]
MCIVLLTTSHPDYALIVVNNRDEFILRPTSRPHWWTPHSDPAPGGGGSGGEPVILSSRDLNRPERGTWLGITRSGNFACLTNYREEDPLEGGAHAVHGVRSRGAIVSAWLGADPAERTHEFVERILSGPGVKGVGGFSLACGKLRRRGAHAAAPARTPAPGAAAVTAPASDRDIDPLVIISNRSEHPDTVPRIASRRGETVGLSNAAFDADGPPWPKVDRGRTLLDEAVARHAAAAAADGSGAKCEDQLVASLFAVLDTETLPRLPGGDEANFMEYIPLLKHTIFVPPLGDAERRRQTAEFDEAARRANVADTSAAEGQAAAAAAGLTAPDAAGSKDRPLTPVAAKAETTPVVHKPAAQDQIMGFSTGLYGTQRQTIILVDWDGNVRYTERSLWDEYGSPVERGQGDVTFRFRVDEWNDHAGC